LSLGDRQCSIEQPFENDHAEEPRLAVTHDGTRAQQVGAAQDQEPEGLDQDGLAVEDEHGEVGGFLHLVPSPAARGYSLSTMRRRPGTPNGLMEFLIAETLAWAKERGASEISLNFCVFTDFLQPELRGWRAVARRALLGLDRLFQLDRLHSFNKKFFPEWRPRYLCVERLSDVPVVGLAYLRVESLLVPPGPWTRQPRVPA